MFRNILVAVDGSCHADKALEEAIDIAVASHGRLTILSAIPHPPAWANSPGAAMASVSLADELETESITILRDAVDRVPESVSVTKILTHDPVRMALAQQLESGQHDLLVMGSRGRGAIRASLLGSVSHYALNHSRIPVLIVHTEADRVSPSAPPTTAAVWGAFSRGPATAPTRLSGRARAQPRSRTRQPRTAGGTPRRRNRSSCRR